jgi:hypothetical protein
MNSSQPFAWCEKLFGDSRVKFVLPKVSVKELIEWMYTSSSVTGQLRALDIIQAREFPGFLFNLNSSLSSTLPRVDLNIGHAGLGVFVGDTLLSVVDVANGIKLNPSSRNIDLEFALELARDNVGPTLEQLVNALTGSSVSSFQIGGFSFGESKSSQLITFSKIKVPLSTKDLRFWLEHLDLASFSPRISPISIHSTDIAVAGKQLGLRSKIKLENTSKIGIQFGELELSVLVQGKPLRIKVGDLRLPRGNIDMESSIDLGLESADESTAIELAKVYQQVQTGKFIDTNFALNGLQFQVPGVPLATIDQFKSLTIELPGSFVTRLLQNGLSVDFSSLGFDDNLFAKLGIRPKEVSIRTLPSRSLQLDMAMQYNNPLPISLSLPFFSTKLSFKNEYLLNIAVSGMNVTRVSGDLQIQAFISTAHSEEAIQYVSELVGSQTHIDGLQISEFRFGVDSNPIDLFSKLAFDVPKWFPKQISIKDLNFGSHLDYGIDRTSVQIGTNSRLQLSLTGNIDTDFKFSADIPHFSGLALIDGTEFSTLSSSLSMSKTFEINTSLVVQKSNDLQMAFKKVVEELWLTSKVSSEFGLRQLEFGRTKEDAITLFSKVPVSFTLPANLQSVLNNFTFISPESVMNDAKFQSLILKTLGGREIALEVIVQLKDSFALSITGLQYAQLVTGLDDIDVMKISTNKLDLGSNFAVSSTLTFPAGEQIRQKIGTFADSLQRNGPGNTEESIKFHGIRFGSSEEDSFRFLESVDFSFDSRKVITKGFVDALQRLFNANQELKLSKIGIDGYRLSPLLSVDLTLGHKSTIQVDLQNVQFETTIDDER